jgi:hypothetical protein
MGEAKPLTEPDIPGTARAAIQLRTGLDALPQAISIRLTGRRSTTLRAWGPFTFQWRKLAARARRGPQKGPGC